MGAFVGALASGVGMGVAGKLFGSSKQGPSQTSTVTQQMAPWEEDYWKFITGRAQNLAQQQYQPYTGERVAGLNTEQRSGIQNAVDSARRWETPFSQAQEAYGTALTPFNASTLNTYMSPYMGDVVSEIGRLGNEQFTGPNGIKSAIESDFTGLGQFGSERMGKVMADAAARNQRETLGQQRQALQAGYKEGLDAYNADRNRLLQGAAGLSALSGQRQALESGTTNALLGVGGLKQQQEQRGLDVGFQNYAENRDWQMNQLLKAAQAGAGARGPVSTTTTTPGPFQPSSLQNFLGGVGLFNGMYRNGMFNTGGGAATMAPAGNTYYGGDDYYGGGYGDGGIGYGFAGSEDPTAGGTFLSGAWKRGGVIRAKKGGVIKGSRAVRATSKRTYCKRGGLATLAA